jgi:non-specific serine/threonine protein kinase
MLETVREFAGERLRASGELASGADRHANFYLELAERSQMAYLLADGALELARIEADHANLRAALLWLEDAGEVERLLRLAGALHRFWHLRGHSREGRMWLERALRRRAEASRPTVARGLLGLARLLHAQGDAGRGLALCDEGLALARAADDPLEVFWGLLICGLITLRLGDLARSAAFQSEALTLLPALGDATWVGCAASTTLGNLGNIAVARGDMERAESYFNEAIARQRALGYAPGTSHVAASHPLAGLGDVARAKGDHATALALYQDATRLAYRFQDTRAIAYALSGVAGTLAAAGRWEQAARLFGAAERFHEQAGLPFNLETMDRQRALGLPEPWLRAGESFGSGQPLRDALKHRVTVKLKQLPDAEAAAWLWADGRSLPIEAAVAEAADACLPAEPAPPADAGRAAGLTPRELDVLRLLAEGLSNREIGEALFISPETARRHATSIYAKLGVTTRTAAAAFAHRHGLV